MSNEYHRLIIDRIDRAEANLGSRLEAVEKQVRETNGRVTKLEGIELYQQGKADGLTETQQAQRVEITDRRQRRAWLPATLTAIACVLLGAALSHYLA